MEVNMESMMPSSFSAHDAIDPNKFDVTISALLIGLGAEKYIEIFRKNNIGQCTLMELSNEDLNKLGVDDETIREKLLEEVKNLPIYNELQDDITCTQSNLNLKEIVDVLEESSQHLHRIYLSMMTNTLALKKTDIADCLIDNDKYASKVALTVLKNITDILNSMDGSLNSQIKALSDESKHRKMKKAIVATIGSAVIVVLGISFVRSLKQL